MKTPLVLISVLLLASCTSFMPAGHTPTIRQLTLQEPPVMAYSRAIQTALKLGAVVVQEDRGAGAFTVQLHNAVSLHVTVQTEKHASLVTVSGILLPSKVVFGSFTEVDDFVIALQKSII